MRRAASGKRSGSIVGVVAGIAEGRPGLEQARKVDGFGL